MPYIPARTNAFQDYVLSTLDPIRAHGLGIGNCVGYAPANGLYSTVNFAMYFPFWLSETTTFTQAWLNMVTPSGNFDLGIYSSSFSRLVSTGSTVATVTSGTQIVDITDTTLNRGYYWFAIACDNTTISIRRLAGFGGTYNRLLGQMMQTSAFPLPATATPTATNQGTMPIFGFTTRSVL